MDKKMNYQNKILSRTRLVSLVRNLKRSGKKIVMTGGVFDILHPGHTRYLEEAKRLGNILLVAVNSDESTRKIKGPKRPINNQKVRIELLAALESVDYVTIFDELTPKEIINQVRPHIWVKGGQYKKEAMPETPVIESYGGKVVILPLEKGYSVSSLFEKIIKEKPVKLPQKGSFIK